MGIPAERVDTGSCWGAVVTVDIDFERRCKRDFRCMAEPGHSAASRAGVPCMAGRVGAAAMGGTETWMGTAADQAGRDPVA